MPITLPCAEIMKIFLTFRKKLLVNDKTNSFLSNKYISIAIIQTVTDTKSELWKTSGLTRFQTLTICSCFCPFVPSFVFAVLLIPSLNVLSDYFLVCQVGGGSYCLNVDKSRHTSPLMAWVVALRGCLIVDSISLRHPLTRFSLKPWA